MGRPKVELVGQELNGRRVIQAEGTFRGRTQWLVECSRCGDRTVRDAATVKTCGCKRCASRRRATSHGQAGTKLYMLWAGMLQRCNNPKHKNFRRYGQRGITVCDRWAIFENFASDMGKPAPGYTLDRINNNGGYCPENCRWATASEQSANREAWNAVSAFGLTISLAQWSRHFGIRANTISHRIRGGWAPEDAVSKPIRSREKSA